MDIRLTWDPARNRGDWNVTAGDLVTGDDLETAVLLSLFTDRLASTDYIAPVGSPQDRHGWWGDTYVVANGGSLIGSRLWQLNRTYRTAGPQLLNKAADYCREALQWLLDDGVAASVAVTTAWASGASSVMLIGITITEPQSPPQTFSYQWAWQGLS